MILFIFSGGHLARRLLRATLRLRRLPYRAVPRRPRLGWVRRFKADSAPGWLAVHREKHAQLLHSSLAAAAGRRRLPPAARRGRAGAWTPTRTWTGPTRRAPLSWPAASAPAREGHRGRPLLARLRRARGRALSRERVVPAAAAGDRAGRGSQHEREGKRRWLPDPHSGRVRGSPRLRRRRRLPRPLQAASFRRGGPVSVRTESAAASTATAVAAVAAAAAFLRAVCVLVASFLSSTLVARSSLARR